MLHMRPSFSENYIVYTIVFVVHHFPDQNSTLLMNKSTATYIVLSYLYHDIHGTNGLDVSSKG